MPKPTSPSPTVVHVGTPNDIIATVPRLLGFQPRDSLVVICAHEPRSRLGLTLRYDLDLVLDLDGFVADIAARVRHQAAAGYFLVVYADDVSPIDGADLPYFGLVDGVGDALDELKRAAYLVVDDSFWTYCRDPTCCAPGPTPLDDTTPDAMTMAAAHAMQGRAVLESREAVAASIGYDGDEAAATRMRELVHRARRDLAGQWQSERRAAVRELVTEECAATRDPHHQIADADVARLAALCEDVVVRDEVLVRAAKPRRRANLQRVLTAAVRRLPPPVDAPLCATLAWVAYSAGEGVVANVALDRALASDPHYSLALLIADSLHRQVAPSMLEEVMRGAARDLRHRGEAG